MAGHIHHIADAVAFAVFRERRVHPFDDMLRVVDIHLDPASFGGVLVRQADAAVVEREVQLLAARIVDAQRDVAVEFVFLGLGVRDVTIRLARTQARHVGQEIDAVEHGAVTQHEAHHLALRVEYVLSDELGPGGEGQRLGGHDAGAQAGEWRRADAHDDLLDIGRSQAGLLDRARDIDLQFLHMGARIGLYNGLAPHNADRRTE